MRIRKKTGGKKRDYSLGREGKRGSIGGKRSHAFKGRLYGQFPKGVRVKKGLSEKERKGK